MGWSLRKSFHILPGVKLNLSKRGPRLSVGVPGARASIDLKGRTRFYAGKGPLRYQKTGTIGATSSSRQRSGGLIEFIRRMMGRYLSR
jgi:hypothetical protein